MNTTGQFKLTVFAFILICNCLITTAQDTTKVFNQARKTYVITKNDGTEYIGLMISQDEREVLLETKEIGRLYIPKHEIKSIRELTENDIKSGVLPGNNIFSTRYFLTTNGLRMQKGDGYSLFDFAGPEIQYSVTDGLSLGALTTWIAMPIVFSAKTTFSANEYLHFGLGVLAGTLGWADWRTLGALPYAAATLGNSKNNFTLSAGYAMISSGGRTDISGSAPLLSIGCLFKITSKISFVGDSFFYLKEGGFAVIVPGIRVSKNATRAFQIGFAAYSTDGKMSSIPIPILGWFIRI